MIEVLKSKISLNTLSNESKINIVREYLQLIILKILFDRGCFENIAFVGGTALRVLYDLHRYSEDLDFSLIKQDNYDFEKLLNEVEMELKNNGFNIQIKAKTKNVVHSCFFKFDELLYVLGISKLRNTILSIKLEIDTNPPKGWIEKIVPITEPNFFAVKSFDIPSLFATKIHACFFRKYTKGRDFYDLVWYLGKKIEPNYLLLNNAIKQTENEDLKIDKNNLKKFIVSKIEKIDFKAVIKDVEVFIENKDDLRMLNKNVILAMLEMYDL